MHDAKQICNSTLSFYQENLMGRYSYITACHASFNLFLETIVSMVKQLHEKSNRNSIMLILIQKKQTCKFIDLYIEYEKLHLRVS